MAFLNGTDVFLPKIYKKDIIDFEIETSVFPAQINGGAKCFANREIVLFVFFFFLSFVSFSRRTFWRSRFGSTLFDSYLPRNSADVAAHDKWTARQESLGNTFLS